LIRCTHIATTLLEATTLQEQIHFTLLSYNEFMKRVNYASLVLYALIGGLQAAVSFIGNGIPQKYAPAIGIAAGALLAIKATLSVHQEKTKGGSSVAHAFSLQDKNEQPKAEDAVE
jgi:hypothetical protein